MLNGREKDDSKAYIAACIHIVILTNIKAIAKRSDIVQIYFHSGRRTAIQIFTFAELLVGV